MINILKQLKITVLVLHEVIKGGQGSGNFGHSGIPGHVGGSGSEGTAPGKGDKPLLSGRQEEELLTGADTSSKFQIERLDYKDAQIISYGVMQAPGNTKNNNRFAVTGTLPSSAAKMMFSAIEANMDEPPMSTPRRYSTRNEAVSAVKDWIDQNQ